MLGSVEMNFRSILIFSLVVLGRGCCTLIVWPSGYRTVSSFSLVLQGNSNIRFSARAHNKDGCHHLAI